MSAAWSEVQVALSRRETYAEDETKLVNSRGSVADYELDFATQVMGLPTVRARATIEEIERAQYHYIVLSGDDYEKMLQRCVSNGEEALLPADLVHEPD